MSITPNLSILTNAHLVSTVQHTVPALEFLMCSSNLANLQSSVRVIAVTFCFIFTIAYPSFWPDDVLCFHLLRTRVGKEKTCPRTQLVSAATTQARHTCCREQRQLVTSCPVSFHMHGFLQMLLIVGFILWPVPRILNSYALVS